MELIPSQLKVALFDKAATLGSMVSTKPTSPTILRTMVEDVGNLRILLNILRRARAASRSRDAVNLSSVRLP
jgi:hypothetical protein